MTFPSKIVALSLAFVAATGGDTTVSADELRVGKDSQQAPNSAPSTAPPSPIAAPQERLLLPEIGGPAGNLMTPVEERRLGQAFMRSVRSSVHVIEEPLMAEYIQDLGARLTENVPGGRSFTFFLVKDPTVNAFAGPGGYIGIHTGLILATESESELASVMAHEIAHVTQNHLFRAFDEYTRMSGPAALAMLGALVLGSVSGQAAAAAIAGIQAGMVQAQVNFTRANEEEADREGIKLLAASGYDPRAMPVFFERMGRATRLYDSNVPEFLRTHPVTPNRIADSRGRAEAHPYRQPATDARYFLIRARVRLDSFKHAHEAETHFRQTLEDGRYRDEDAQRYGYALALAANRKYAAARSEIDKLLRKEPLSPAYLIASARIDNAAGHASDAVNELDAASRLIPGNYPLAMEYAELLLEVGKPEKAKLVLLEQMQLSRVEDINLYRLLARVHAALGEQGEANRYQAEYYFAVGQLEAAVRQLEIALRQPDLSFYESAKLAARLQQMRYERELEEESENR